VGSWSRPRTDPGPADLEAPQAGRYVSIAFRPVHSDPPSSHDLGFTVSMMHDVRDLQPSRSWGRRIAWSLPWGRALLALLLLAVLPAPAAPQGLTYSVALSGRWIDWDSNLGFERTRLIGGSVGLGFGRYVSLTASHHQDNDTRWRSTLSESPFDVLGALSQTGGRIELALGSGAFVPLLLGGGSLLRFGPEGVDEFTKLSLDAGGGIRLTLGPSFTGEVLVESSTYRLDEARLLGEPAAGTGESVRHNLSVRAGIGLRLGQRPLGSAAELDRAFAERYRSPFSNFALAVEPVAGRLQFDGSTGLGDQDLVGLRVGIDFGSFFGLRGFHSWGTESGFASFNGFKTWGGEAQFNLASGASLNPYLVGGVGLLDWDDLDDVDAPRLDRQTALIVGGGVDLGLGSSLRLTVGARDHVLAGADITGSLEDASEPSDLVHNWQFTAGLKLVVGQGGIRSAAPAPTPGFLPEGAAARQDTVSDGPAVIVRGDTVMITGAAAAQQARTIVLPVLEQGEIYIRFGEPGPTPLLARAGTGPDTSTVVVDEQTLRVWIRQELERIDATVGAEDLRALEERLVRRLGELEPAEPAPATEVTNMTIEEAAPEHRELRAFSGFTLTGGTQMLLGIATDLGPMSPGSKVNLVPHFALGFGQGKPSYLLGVSLEYGFPEFALGSAVRLAPMVSTAPSLFRQEETRVRLGTFLGTGIRIFESGTERFHLIAGYQGIDLFGQGRIVGGIRIVR